MRAPRCSERKQFLTFWCISHLLSNDKSLESHLFEQVMVQNAFSIPGAKKPEHIFYDTNCLARQQAEKSFPWFKEIGMCVDVWHFLNKHQTTHQYCQENCNPIQFPELLDEFGKWFFNTSVAEQINAWLQGYHSIVREMLPDKFDFFLDEMIMRRNVEHLKKLEEQGHNPRSLDD
jgi:hypothetical protein